MVCVFKVIHSGHRVWWLTAPVNIQLSDRGINKDAVVNQKLFDLMKSHWSKHCQVVGFFVVGAGNLLFKKFYHILCSQSQKEDGGPKKPQEMSFKSEKGLKRRLSDWFLTNLLCFHLV